MKRFTSFAITTGLTCVAALSGAARLSAQDPSTPPASGAQPTKTDAPSTDAQRKTDAAPSDKPPAAATLNRENPRATMRTFLVAVQDAAGDKPERIDGAVACMDISQLPADGRMDQARQLARRLHAAIDRIGLKLDDIPAESGRANYVFYEAQSDAAAPPVNIALARAGDAGPWLFTVDTLAALPAIERYLTTAAAPVVIDPIPRSKRQKT